MPRGESKSKRVPSSSSAKKSSASSAYRNPFEGYELLSAAFADYESKQARSGGGATAAPKQLTTLTYDDAGNATQIPVPNHARSFFIPDGKSLPWPCFNVHEAASGVSADGGDSYSAQSRSGGGASTNPAFSSADESETVASLVYAQTAAARSGGGGESSNSSQVRAARSAFSTREYRAAAKASSSSRRQR